MQSSSMFDVKAESPPGDEFWI
ncbi:hypothetical protein JL09_g5407 [Pichia kudriavzevii]|uniref:Uncharacterized protein n=1 Tax=Pichia kudriavzevii TaxID=4909 RepID=A0A099NRR2_PICKU|nr:hypothetical protein JL09_g5407 [Pichia kudriavzevii]